MVTKNLFKAHPWHGVSIGEAAPKIVNAYIEIVPTDTVKYEVDKETGHLKVDRPQKYSNYCPTLYGFIPQTYCGQRVGERGGKAIGRENLEGDMDPLDICVLTERPITHGDILVRAIPIGGFRMIDRNEVDDKIIAVLNEDNVYGNWTNIDACNPALIDRLKHYFLTYKFIPGLSENKVEIASVFDRAEAEQIIKLSQKDYREIIKVES